MPFWKILGEIQIILKADISLELVHCIIGVSPRENLPKQREKLIQILLLVASKMITKSWLKAEPPTLDQWQEGLKREYLMAKITAQLLLRVDQFNDLWTS